MLLLDSIFRGHPKANLKLLLGDTAPDFKLAAVGDGWSDAGLFEESAAAEDSTFVFR